MILKKLEPRIDEKEFREVYPRYDGQSLPNLIHTLVNALGVKTGRTQIDSRYYKDHIDLSGIEKVVLVVLDGLGYRMWLDAGKDEGLLGRIADRGLLMPITTVFPSTTAAAVTTINTGLTPLEHGLPEWVLYMREISMIINTLPFTQFISERNTSLSRMGVDPKILYDGRTIYETLSDEGISSHTIVGRNLANSAYNTIIKKGSNSHPYVYPNDAVIKLRRILESERGRAYINIYMDNIDSSTHTYGPFTEESRGEIGAISSILKTQLLDKVDRRVAKDTLVVVTADHGHTKIDPRKITYMNGDRKLASFLATDKGSKILPTGSARGVFLHINKSDVENAYSHLKKKFQGKAQVMRSKDAIRMGLFGNGKPHRRFEDRAGDLIVLPRDGEAIWYEHMKGRKLKTLGVHGGMSQNEMIIPMGMAKLSDII